MKTADISKSLGFVVLVAVGVFLAGITMTALRDNDFVRRDINGFDS